ncbi:MAG TPA: ATP-binding protein [Planktothrix sp.]|jgi:signal transduction histidine kinase
MNENKQTNAMEIAEDLLIAATLADGQVVSINVREPGRELPLIAGSLFAEFIRQCPAVCFITDASGQYVYANDAFEEHFAIAANEVLGKTGAQLFGAEHAHQFGTVHKDVLDGNQQQEIVQIKSALHNDLREWLICKFPCLGENQQMLIGVVALDLGKARHGERQLKGQAELLELILNNIGDPVIAVDATGKLLLFNPAAIRLYGMGILGTAQTRATDRFGLFLPDCTTPYPKDELPLARAIRGETVTDLEIFVRTPDMPDGVFLSAKAQAIVDNNGTLKGGAAVFRDITARKRAEEDLQNSVRQLKEARDEAIQASELKSQFVSNISHELRTPMSGVLGMTELLMESKLNPEQQELASYIYESSQSLLFVLNELLDFSRLEAGTLKLDNVKFDPRTIVHEAVDAMKLAAGRKHLHITKVFDDKLPARFSGDGRRIKQVLVHYVQNAVKFTETGTIEVRVAIEKRVEDQAYVRFSVKDSGIGMSEEDLQNVFAPFVQADGSSTRKYGGVGLGLSICKRVVKLMTGTLGVTSKQGEGSEFWFTVPLECIEP